jgi:hypothetical protein
MLQLHGNKLKLYKPSMQGGRAAAPTWMIRMNDVTDIRPINDTREAVSAFTQCYPKQWGVTLEGTRSIFTFYTRNKDEMRQWVDLLKNSPLFSASTSSSTSPGKNTTPTRLTIPVHPVATVEFNPILEPKMLLTDRIGKLGDLIATTFAVFQFVLLDDGKLMYYIDEDAANQRARPIGTIRCDSIVSIVPSYATAEGFGRSSSAVGGSGMDIGNFVGNFGGVPMSATAPESTTTSAPTPLTEDQLMPWRLELGIMINHAVQKYRRSVVMCFESQDRMMKWGASISRETKRLTGHEYDLSSITRRPSRSNSYNQSLSASFVRSSESQFGRPTVARVITNPLKYCDPRVSSTPPLYRSLKDVVTKSATKGWFFLRKPRVVGYESYHPRFAVLHEQQLLNMREIKDVREAESGYQENLDFTIQLTTSADVVWMVSESVAYFYMFTQPQPTLVYVVSCRWSQKRLLRKRRGCHCSFGSRTIISVGKFQTKTRAAATRHPRKPRCLLNVERRMPVLT